MKINLTITCKLVTKKEIHCLNALPLISYEMGQVHKKEHGNREERMVKVFFFRFLSTITFLFEIRVFAKHISAIILISNLR